MTRVVDEEVVEIMKEVTIFESEAQSGRPWVDRQSGDGLARKRSLQNEKKNTHGIGKVCPYSVSLN